MRSIQRAVSVLLVMLLLSAYGLLAVAAETQPLTITAPSDSVAKKQSIELTVNTSEPVSWSSSNPEVATVDPSGIVTGVKVGTVTITAETADGQKAETMIYVTRSETPWRTLLQNRQVLGYRYNYKGDYYYTDDKDCWQRDFGFNFIYDFAAPLFFLEYDYVRVFFPYQGKDWMVQMWKGQYGFVFYGSEVGLYTKPEGKEAATRVSHYACADAEDYLQMETMLERKNKTTGEYDFEFERPYDYYWWATGFVPGHLWDTTPCNELRATTHITFKDEEMAQLYTDGLLVCGFNEVESRETIRSDTFYRDGADVYLIWQDISEAANHHVMQTAFYGTIGIGGVAVAIVGVLLVLVFLLLFALLGGGIFLILLI